MASAVNAVMPEMWRVVNRIATAKQYCFLGKGFCAFCGMLETSHADDCLVLDAQKIVSGAKIAANG